MFALRVAWNLRPLRSETWVAVEGKWVVWPSYLRVCRLLCVGRGGRCVCVYLCRPLRVVLMDMRCWMLACNRVHLGLITHFWRTQASTCEHDACSFANLLGARLPRSINGKGVSLVWMRGLAHVEWATTYAPGLTRGCMSAYYWVFHNNIYNRLSDCFWRSWNFYGLVFLFCAVVWGTRAYAHTDLQAARSGMNARLIYYYGVFVSMYFHYYYYNNYYYF